MRADILQEPSQSQCEYHLSPLLCSSHFLRIVASEIIDVIIEERPWHQSLDFKLSVTSRLCSEVEPRNWPYTGIRWARTSECNKTSIFVQTAHLKTVSRCLSMRNMAVMSVDQGKKTPYPTPVDIDGVESTTRTYTCKVLFRYFRSPPLGYRNSGLCTIRTDERFFPLSPGLLVLVLVRLLPLQASDEFSGGTRLRDPRACGPSTRPSRPPAAGRPPPTCSSTACPSPPGSSLLCKPISTGINA